MLGVFTKRDATSGAVDGDLATQTKNSARRHFNAPGDPVQLPFDQWKPLLKSRNRKSCSDMEGGRIRKYTGWFEDLPNGARAHHMIAEVLYVTSRRQAGPAIKYKQVVRAGNAISNYPPKEWRRRA